MSLSQKVDSLFGFFASDRKVSGSGDPFGVRRMALSIINILIDKKKSLSFSFIFEVLVEIYKIKILKLNSINY